MVMNVGELCLIRRAGCGADSRTLPQARGMASPPPRPLPDFLDPGGWPVLDEVGDVRVEEAEVKPPDKKVAYTIEVQAKGEKAVPNARPRWSVRTVQTAKHKPSSARRSSFHSTAQAEAAVPAPAPEDFAHGHGKQSYNVSSIVTGVASGAVCAILYFFFCIVFSAVIFTEITSTTSFGVADGVNIVLLGIGVGCLTFAHRSSCKVIISGPDLLPIIFVQESGVAIQAYLKESDEPHGGVDKVIPTTLVAMIMGNVCVGALFFFLGKKQKTASAIGFVPASVISGFLSCIGYKVAKLAVFISTTHKLKFKYVNEDYLLRDYDDRMVHIARAIEPRAGAQEPATDGTGASG